MVALLAAGVWIQGIQQCGGGGDDDDTTVCVDPVNGNLKAGDWGGEHWLWRVNDDGTIYVETDCAHGTTAAPVVAEGGNFSFDLEMVGEAGPVSDPPSNTTYKASFSGQVCGVEASFTYTVDASATAGSVVLNEPAMLMKCY
jgi:hypothetical protein